MESGWPWVIKILREETQVSQEELARELDVSFSSVSRWERGIGKPGRQLRRFIGQYYLRYKNDISEGYRKAIEEFFKKEKVRNFR